ncbi:MULTISPECIES: LuxR C-terminal-related transcriptional regulator [unclassified Sphingobium]|uniref:LuxR C-terminal-related transcriptional regulator n=1 Tax=unclassified Sphingobium TaxID=2611147 RepID=UPI0035A68CE7
MTDPQTKRSIMILEDSAATRDWLVGLVERALPGGVVATTATLAEARRWLARQPAGSTPLCLVDLGLPDGSGVDFIRDLLRALPGAKPVVTTLFDDNAHLLGAMAAGAQGYLLKDQEPEDLRRRLASIDRGELPISPAMATRILDQFRAHARFVEGQAAPDSALTPRETDVLRLIGRGLKVSEAAGALGISESTVSGYLKTIYRKLDISSRAEAAVEAVRRGLV